ncbi:MAG: hypothetical protein ACI39C_14955 [Dietzia sp.]
MDLHPIDTTGFDADVLTLLDGCEANIRYDGDRDPLLWVRSLVTALNSAGAWPGRRVLATPETGLVNEGIDLKVNVAADTYVSCFIDSVEELLGDDDPSWRAIGQAITDRLNEEIHTARGALLDSAHPQT